MTPNRTHHDAEALQAALVHRSENASEEEVQRMLGGPRTPYTVDTSDVATFSACCRILLQYRWTDDGRVPPTTEDVQEISGRLAPVFPSLTPEQVAAALAELDASYATAR